MNETHNDFLCYCPFHGNTDTTAFSVSKRKGTYICFNPACGVSGSLEDLMVRLNGMNLFEIRRAVLDSRTARTTSRVEELNRVRSEPFVFKEFPQGTIDRLAEEFWDSQVAIDYMHSRHFDDETLRFFEVGYSAKTGMITVPMHDPSGMPIGLIGRTPSDTDKRFKNSKALPKSMTLFNLHRAKHYDVVIVVEASYDVMRLHQAGFPYAVATLGGNISNEQIEMLNRYFSKVIIMTDNDPATFYGVCRRCVAAGHKSCQGHRPGRDLGNAIATRLKNKKVQWAVFSDTEITPSQPLEGYRKGPAKDPGNMNDEEIRTCIRNAISDFEFSRWVLQYDSHRGTMDTEANKVSV